MTKKITPLCTGCNKPCNIENECHSIHHTTPCDHCENFPCIELLGVDAFKTCNNFKRINREETR
jgi:hypothetical protein